MSRVGKAPIVVPKGVSVVVSEMQDGIISISAEGPNGKLSTSLAPHIACDLSELGGNKFLQLKCLKSEDKQARANFGTARALTNNVVVGVSTGFKKVLEMNGVGFGAKFSSGVLVLSVGFSHEVALQVPEGVSCVTTKTTIEVSCADKQVVTNFAAKIKNVWPPEPYLGKGIKYQGEVIRRKAGKTGKK
jgi:large subunit ribosomal protein L6